MVMKRMMDRLSRVIFLLLLGFGGVNAQTTWPRTIALKEGGSVTIYQPQPESYQNNKIVGRSALSVKEKAGSEPVFGAMFYEATLSTERDNRMADLELFKVTNIKFPGIEEEGRITALARAIEDAAMNARLEISIDQLLTSIDKETGHRPKDNFKNDAPLIIVTNKPSTLVLIDGEPKIRKDEDLEADRVMNTPYLILREGGLWHLYAGGLWYKSNSVTDGWEPNTKLTRKLRSIDRQIRKQEKEENGGKAVTDNPQVTEIIVKTEPAELLQTNGEPQYKTIEGTSLLFVSNTNNEIFKDINTQRTYILLTGRWYAAAGINGPWNYISADELPADFAKIPEGSEMDGVLSSVAGTAAAEEARIDSEIPQTAKVDRNTAKAEISYDGDPIFERIEGTSLELATNTASTVIRSNGKYYAVDNGIWFESASARGPWSVATERPADVDNIPPSCAAYHTKYVYVYEATPRYVYVGYTPGYLGSYIYGPTVVYGTGYYYRPWFGTYYYPRPVTWGFGFNYNPWTGWSMNVGFNVGFLYVGYDFWRYGAYSGGWFGPPMWRPPYRPPYHGGYYGRYRPSPGPGGTVTRPSVRPSPVRPGSGNIYNRRPGTVTRDADRRPAPGTVTRPGTERPATRPAPKPATKPVKRPERRPGGQTTRPGTEQNNVFADPDGNVYRKEKEGGWNQRDNKTNVWKPADRSGEERMKELNRASQQRERGVIRQQNYERNRPQSRPSATRPATRPANRPATKPSTPTTRPKRTGG